MTKFAATGTGLWRDNVEIAQVSNITGPNLSVDMVDVSTHDGDNWEEFVPTILRTGTVTLDIIYDPSHATHVETLRELVDREQSTYELRYPDTARTKWTFDAFVSGFTPTAPVAGVLTASVTFKLTGKPVLAGNYPERGTSEPAIQKTGEKTTNTTKKTTSKTIEEPKE